MTTQEHIANAQADIKWRCKVLLAGMAAGDMDLFARDWRVASIGTYVAKLCRIGGMHDIHLPTPRQLPKRVTTVGRHCEHCEC